MELRPLGAWLQALLRALGPRLGDLEPRELAAVIWALGRLKFKPGDAWLAALSRRLSAARARAGSGGGGGLGAREAVTALWGLARLRRDEAGRGALVELQEHLLDLQGWGHVPAAAAAAHSGGSSGGGEGLGSGPEQGAADAAAGGGARVAPPLPRASAVLALLCLAELPRGAALPRFAEMAVSESERHFLAMAPGELAQCVHALGAARYRPPPRWAAAALGAAGAAAAGMDEREIAMLLWGVARLQVGGRGCGDKGACVHAHTQKHLRAGDCIHAVGRGASAGGRVWVWGQRRVCVHGHLRKGMRSHAQRSSGASRGCRLCGRRRTRTRARARASACTGHDARRAHPSTQPPPRQRSLPSIPKRAQLNPGLAWMAGVLTEAAEQLPSFRPHSLANMLLALGLMGVKPNKEWMGPVLERARVLLK